MTVTDKAWQSYIKKLSAINRKAAKIMQDWISVNGLDYPEELISYAYGIVGKYGEAAGSLACEMYDTLARAQGKILPDAVPAEPATYSEVARAVIGTKKERPGQVPNTVARLVKQTAADTTLQNAKRDGAQFAWIPHGDTCSFCITLASRGWQYMSKNALKNGHAEHIHANCDCEYGVRFDGKSNVAGYDPDKYLEQYNNAEGTKPQDKINSMRREQYAKDADKINSRRRELYAEKKNSLLSAATTEVIGPSGEHIIDYIDARNFAGDDIKLQNMLRSNDTQQVSTAVDEVLNQKYNLQRSSWTGKTIAVPDGSLGRNVVGKANWDNTISICESSKNNLKVHIHELLHMRSVNTYGEKRGIELLLSHRAIEEGAVEYFAQEICKSSKIEFGGTYQHFVDPLRYIRKVVVPLQSDLAFANELFDKPLAERYNYLKEIVEGYRKNNPEIRMGVVEKLEQCMRTLGGSEKK